MVKASSARPPFLCSPVLQARALLLQPGRGLLQALVSQLQSWNSLRRLGASGAIKNCVISAEVRERVRVRVAATARLSTLKVCVQADITGA